MKWLLVLFVSIGVYVFGFYITCLRYLDIISTFLSYNFYPFTQHGDYDYIVVGCGSAGSLLALRLAADVNSTVLVLEAGPRGGSLLDIPAVAPFLQLSDIDWQYRTVPQQNAAKALTNNVSNWPMGRIVGGSSKLNNLIYLQGHQNDFKEWTDDSAYYFKQSGLYKRDSNHVNVEDLRMVSPLANAVLKAAEILGYPLTDLNLDGHTGFMQVKVNMNSGQRWTTSHVLLQNFAPNIDLQTNSYATKVLFASNFEATAVEYTLFGRSRTARARKAIVLCAGAIGTPKILMQSGVGPAQHLSEVGIETKIDLPVGNNLQDHVTTGLDLLVLNQSLGLGLADVFSPTAAFEYFAYGSGPWTTIGCEVSGILDTESGGSAQPDLQLLVLPFGVSSDKGIHLRRTVGVSNRSWSEYFEPLIGNQVASILPIVLHPKSRGTVRLMDNNPYSKPIIDPQYLADPYDTEILLRGIDLIKKLIQTDPMQKLGASLNDVVFPGCEDHAFDTKAYWECYVRHVTITMYHPVGTCAADAVVDRDFRVFNTNKLYVADGSVLPTLPSANPNAAIIMVAEKVADIILHQHSLLCGYSNIKNVFEPKSACDIR